MKITENYIIYVILHYHSVNTYSVVHASYGRVYQIMLDFLIFHGIVLCL